MQADLPLRFQHRPDLSEVPNAIGKLTPGLHTTFARDNRDGFGHIYYTLQGVGVVRISADLREHEVVPLPSDYAKLNFHSTRLFTIKGQPTLVLVGNEAGLVVLCDLKGRVLTTLGRPQLASYADSEAKYMPTDAALDENLLYIADGYGQDFICVYDLEKSQWLRSFGGYTQARDEDGKFRTTHGMTFEHSRRALVISDRWNSRLQVHDLEGKFLQSHLFPYNAWPCGISFTTYQGLPLGSVACLYDTDEEKKRPAPVFIVHADNYEILETLRPKEQFGLQDAQRMHSTVWHHHEGSLYLLCTSWNPGSYFVLELLS